MPYLAFNWFLSSHRWTEVTEQLQAVWVAGTSDPQLFSKLYYIRSSFETQENVHFKYNRSLQRRRLLSEGAWSSQRTNSIVKRVHRCLIHLWTHPSGCQSSVSLLYLCRYICRPPCSYNLPHISFCICVQHYQGKVFGDWQRVIDTLTMFPQ